MRDILTVLPLISVLLAACGTGSNQPDGSTNSPAGLVGSRTEPREPGATPSSGADDGVPDMRSVRSEGSADLLRPEFMACVTDAAGMTAETQSCIEAEFAFHEARLDAALTSRRQILDANGRRSLDDDQRRWAELRDAQCAWDAGEEGQAQRLEANLCLLEATAQRANDVDVTGQPDKY
jgi:uncharacterized protein YecT (DUF1311 family)